MPEWARLRKYARRMRELSGINALSSVSSELLSVLQHCAISDPLFPNLKTFEWWSTAGEFIPFIPLFLSPGTVIVTILLDEPSNLPKVMAASMLTTLPTLCPNMQEITLDSLPRDPIITSAISGMLLASNWDTLRSFQVDSPLTKGALEVICKLPNLRNLWVVVERDTSPPTVVLPNLTNLVIKYDHDRDWLRVFHGATLGKLETIEFHSGSEQIGDFLEEFERVALATSAHNTLSKFSLRTSRSWNPSYSSLLPFTQLTHLCIESSCDNGCSSTVDDDIIADLARAMPKLQNLELGDIPCGKIPTGVTAEGLVALAHHCPDLTTLRIHFQADSLSDPPAIDGVPRNTRSATPQRGCALKNLEVEHIPVPTKSVSRVAVTLALIFPSIEYIDCFYPNWSEVVDAISYSREIVNYSSKNVPFYVLN